MKSRTISISWPIKPNLWFAEKPITKSFLAEGIEFVIELVIKEGKCVEGKSKKTIIKARLENPTISETEFYDKAAKVVEQFMTAYILVERRFFEVGNLICKYSQSKYAPPSIVEVENGEKGPTMNITTPAAIEASIQCRVMKTGEKIDNDFNLSRRIFELSIEKKGLSLRGSLRYYRLALAGSDQLLTAGNLYMVMEELKEAKEFTSWSDAYEKLEKFSPDFSKAEYEKLQEVLQNGRHAYFTPRRGSNQGKRIKSTPLNETQISYCKQVVRELILAYVECLKSESKVRPI